MATLAEIMTNNVTQGQSPGESLQKGAALAIQMEQNQLAQQQLIQKKSELQSVKYEKFVEAFNKGVKYEGQAKSKYYKEIMPRYRDSLGLGQAFPDSTMQFITADPKNMSRLNTIVAQVRSGKVSEEEAIALINDPTQFADVNPEYMGEMTESLAKAATTRINADAQAQGHVFNEKKEFNERKQKLVKAMDDSQMTELDTRFKTIAKLVPGIFDPEKKGADGKTAGVTSMADIPTNLLSDSNSQLRQEALGILNARLKKMSGSAVTASELPRLAQSMGMKIGPLEGGGFVAIFQGTPSAKQFTRGMRQLRTIIENEKGNLRRAYGDDAYNAVLGSSGTSTDNNQVPVDANGSETQAQAGQRSLNELDNEETVMKLNAIIKGDPARLDRVATRYGITGRMLQKILMSGGQ